MSRNEIVKALQEHRTELQQLGIRRLGLFGSHVRDEARPDSDVDLLVDIEGVCGLFRFSQLQRHLEGLLQKRVDLVTVNALHRALRQRILNEVWYV
jgi:uncharacterized protein